MKWIGLASALMVGCYGVDDPFGFGTGGGALPPWPGSQSAYLKASNTDPGDLFGYSVAIDGDTIVVGARAERSIATGVNPAGTDNSASDAGAAYVFRRVGGVWTPEAYLKASNTGAGDMFGWGVAVSGDTIVVGAPGEASAATTVNGNQASNSAPNAGAAYVYVRAGGVWTQQAYLKASNTDAGDLFGRGVAISGDTIVVGAVGEDSSSAGVNGSGADNSLGFAGAAYVFVRTGGTWAQEAYLKASNPGPDDEFGQGVAISGDTIVVGAFLEDSGATGVNGNQADNSQIDAGAAYVFVRTGGTWAQEAYLKASNAEMLDHFGSGVAISGDTLVVGAEWEASTATGVNGNQMNNSNSYGGAAYVFVRAGVAWAQQAYLKSSDTDGADFFGHCVAISGDRILVGAYGDDHDALGIFPPALVINSNSRLGSGAAYLFERAGGAWTPTAFIKSSNSDMDDQVGVSVGISGGTFVVGGNLEDGDATGVGGNEADNSAADSGAAYVFQ